MEEIKNANAFMQLLNKFPLEYSPEKEALIRKMEENEKSEEKQRRLRYYRSKDSGVPQYFWNESFETFKPQNDNDAKNLKAVKDFCTLVPNRKVLLMYGKCGTGKSHLGASIIRECGGRMIDSDSLLLMVEKGGNFKSSESKFEILSKFSEYNLLVLDEIGRSMSPQKEKGYLSFIIRNRYNNKLPTVLITTLTKSVFLKFLGEPVMDRLRETCIPLEFNGESYRPRKREITDQIEGDTNEIN